MLIGISDLISSSWHNYKTNFKNLIPFMLLFFVPNLITLLASVGLDYLVTYSISSVSAAIISIVILVINALLTFWIVTALVVSVAAIVRTGSVMPWRQAMQSTIALLFPLFINTLLVVLATSGPMLLLVLLADFFAQPTLWSVLLIVLLGLIAFVYAIIVSGWFIFARPELLLNKQSSGFLDVGALSRSKQLVRGRWFTIVFSYIVPNFIFGIIFVAILLATSVLLSLATIFLPDTAHAAVVQIYSALVASAFIPLPLFVLITLYFSAKENPVGSAPVAKPAA